MLQNRIISMFLLFSVADTLLWEIKEVNFIEGESEGKVRRLGP
jgi:hypothetical protein